MNEDMKKILEKAEKMMREEYDMMAKHRDYDALHTEFSEYLHGLHIGLIAANSVIASDPFSDDEFSDDEFREGMKKSLELITKLRRESYEKMVKARDEEINKFRESCR